MGCVHVCEAKECTLENPLVVLCLFNPVAGDCKVAVRVTSLPCIARYVNQTSDGLALKIK